MKTPRKCSLKDLTFYFLKLGATGFGGPIALVTYMERDLVEERGWIAKDEYLRGLTLAQLAPGPLATQLAIYLGYVRGKVLGASLAAVAFVLPSFLMVLAIARVYAAHGELPVIRALFYGIGAAIIAIIARSCYKLARLTLKKSPWLWSVFALMGTVTAWTEREIAALFLLCGAASIFVLARPRKTPSLVAVLPLAAASANAPPGLWGVFLYFLKASAFVFGSGLAIVPFLHGGVVTQYHWLTERQFLDAVAVAMITPGPVVVTVAFIGCLIGGPAAAVVAALGVYLPVYLFVVLPAPHLERYAKNPQLKAFVDGVTAAASGAIAGAVYILARGAIVDRTTALIAAGSLAALAGFDVPEPILIAASGALGLALAPWR